MLKISTLIGTAVRLMMLVMVVWFLVSVVVPTRDPLVIDLAAVVVLAVLALIGPVRRFLVSSVVGRPNGETPMRR